MIETQKHQQSFEALGLFQIDFGLMTLISEIFLFRNRKRVHNMVGGKWRFMFESYGKTLRFIL